MSSKTTIAALIMSLVILTSVIGWVTVSKNSTANMTMMVGKYQLSDVTGAQVQPGKILYTLTSGAQRLFADLPDVYADHYHAVEFHNGNVYVIRRIGDTNSATWTDSLWKISPDRKMTQLYSHQGFDFRVSNDEQWLAVQAVDSDQTFVQIVHLTTQQEKKYTLSDVEGKFGKIQDFIFDGWTSQDVLWGHSFHADKPVFAAINAGTEVIEDYPFPSNMPGQVNDFAFNLDKEIVAYSTYPLFLDQESADQFSQQKSTVTLYTYRFSDGKLLTIATSMGGKFSPNWKDSRTLKYTNSESGELITAVVQ